MAGNSKGIEILAQGIEKDNSKGTNTIFFMHPHEIPKGCKPTYLQVLTVYQPHKDDLYQVHYIIMANLVN